MLRPLADLGVFRAAQKNRPKQVLSSALGELRKSSQPKKNGRQNFRKLSLTATQKTFDKIGPL